jgi:hydrophobic/amphiphilic exporter-1 (mainly G- bacteria), HAE1 family
MADHFPTSSNGSSGGSNGHKPDEPVAGLSSGVQKMWLSDLSIRQPVFITMLVVAVVLVGLISYSRLGLELMPNVSMQIITVSTTYAGAAPSDVERSVSKPIEDAVASISGVKAVRSTSSESSSVVTIEFESSTDIKTAAEDVRTQIGMVRNTLPSDVQDPVIRKTDTAAMPVLAFAVADTTNARTPEELRSLVDNQLKQQFERLDGVGSVYVLGGTVGEVHVDASLQQLQSRGVSIQQLSQAIRAESTDMPAGRVPQGATQEQLVRTATKATTLDQLGEIPVAVGQGVAKLKDLATISMSHADIQSYTRLDGSDSILVAIMQQSGTNTVRVADTIQASLKAIQRQYPELSFGIVFDQSTYTRESISDVQLSLLMGGILAALVVFLFFRDIRNTLVTVAGLPVVVLGTFIALNALGISLNMISMMALSLSVGLLIDDAIVVRENIFRHVELGEEPKAAAGKGAAEIAMAVLAVTSTIVAVFLPIAFTSGLIGQFLRDFGLTISIAVLISLAEAFTLAPMLSAFFFHKVDPSTAQAHKSGRFGSGFEALSRGYGRLLGWSLNHRRIVVALGVACLVASLGLIPLLSQSFQPATDQGEFAVMMELTPGASLQEADRVTRTTEQILRTEPAVAVVFSSVGSNGGASNTASVGVKLKSRGHTAEVLDRMRPTLSNALPGVKLSYNTQSAAAGALGSAAASAMTSLPIQYKIQGPDFAKLDQVSQDVAARLAAVPGIVDVDRSSREGGPQQAIVLDRARATDLGVSASQVASTMRTLINGDKAGSFQSADRDMDIVVRLAASDRDDLSKVLQLPISTSRGSQIPLSTVAGLLPSTESAKIDRENRQRQVLVAANATGNNTGPALAQAKAAVASVQLPDGVSIKEGGDAASMTESFSSLGLAMALSVAFMYMILASQFGSFVHPFTIMLALPFSIIGALLALVLAHFSLDSLAMIGMILLMGLVTKNSILLVEFTNQLRRRGLGTRDAILQAGPVRLRPIMMTTLSMICGMLPVAVGFGAGSELRQPMGVSVIGGVITSTVLTLVAVPVAYSLIDDLGNWILRRFRHAPAGRGQPQSKLSEELPSPRIEAN